MTATYTFDVFTSLDGFGAASANWTGYWGKQGPELLDRRLALYEMEQRMVFGAATYREFAAMLASSTEESDVRDPWVTRMWNTPRENARQIGGPRFTDITIAADVVTIRSPAGDGPCARRRRLGVWACAVAR